jgi:hypothetical protein
MANEVAYFKLSQMLPVSEENKELLSFDRDSKRAHPKYEPQSLPRFQPAATGFLKPGLVKLSI